MEDRDKARFAALMTGIAEYYSKALSVVTAKLYWEGLKQHDFGAVEKALWEHTQNPDNGQFMPKIADVTRNLQGRTTDQAALAWSKVDSAIRRIGTYQDVVFDDAIIHRVIADMGGWIKFGTMNDEEWPFTGNQFRTRYQGYRMRGEVPEYQPVLVGMSNAHNGKEGFRTNPPMLVGDQTKAQQVLLGGTNEPLIQMKLASAVVPEKSETPRITH